MVIEDFKLDAPKTNDYKQILNSLKLDNQKTLLVLSENDSNIYLSARNLQKTKVTKADSLNTYEIFERISLLKIDFGYGPIDCNAFFATSCPNRTHFSKSSFSR